MCGLAVFSTFRLSICLQGDFSPDISSMATAVGDAAEGDAYDEV